VLEGHSNNVSSVMFHPSLPIILSGSEDGTVRIWHSTTYRLENTLNYGMERVWSLSSLKDSNRIAIGYDEGTVMLQIGQEEPVVSMDKSGKIVWARNQEITGANVKTVNFDTVADGEKLPVSTKEMGNCEVYPQTMMHDPKGRLLAVCGDGEYVIYTALSLNNKSYGSALEFVWASHASGVYATRESPSRVKIFKNFKETQQFRPNFPAEAIYGGALLGIKSSEFIDFYEWEECRIIRRIEVNPTKVFWSDSGDLAILACENSYFVLRLNRGLVNKYLEQRIEVSEQGIDDAFIFEKEIGEEIKSGSFVGDCFIYTNGSGRLNYYVGGEVLTLAHLDKPYFVLGYLPKDNRVYLIDKQFNVVSYSLLVSVLIYQTAIVRGDFEAANQTLSQIPIEHHNRLARFLEAQNLKEIALSVSQDNEHRFDLALQLDRLDVGLLLDLIFLTNLCSLHMKLFAKMEVNKSGSSLEILV
jgi:coatomer subunit beta'